MLENFVGANVARCKLSLDMETLHTFKWGHPEVDKISHLEGKRSSTRIRITLLSGLCGLQMVADQLHLFLDFLDDVRAKHLAFSSF
jgi:hypothetical protein